MKRGETVFTDFQKISLRRFCDVREECLKEFHVFQLTAILLQQTLSNRIFLCLLNHRATHQKRKPQNSFLIISLACITNTTINLQSCISPHVKKENCRKSKEEFF